VNVDALKPTYRVKRDFCSIKLNLLCSFDDCEKKSWRRKEKLKRGSGLALQE